MSKLKNIWNKSWPVGSIIIFSFICNILSFFMFVGTDVGGYYEISRVLFEQGKLALFDNYWDHKPILIYFWFLPFHWLDIFISYSSLGLRIGAWLLYCTNAILLYIGFLKVSSVFDIADTWKSKIVYLFPALFYCSISFSTLDYAQNNILSMASFGLSFAGLLFSLAYLYSNHKCLHIAFLAGFILSCAVFFRPTGIAGIVTCIVIGLFFYKHINLSKMVTILLSVFFFCVVLLITTITLGTSWQNLWNTLIVFNFTYSSIYQDATSVFDFLTFNKSFLTQFIVLILLILGNSFTCFYKFKKISISQKIVISSLIIWGIVELSIAFILQRKMIGYYLLAPLFVIFCTAYLALFISRLFKEQEIQTRINAFILFCCILYYPIENIQVIPKEVYSNSFASQEKMPTAEVIRTIQANTQWKYPRIFVYGNRANIYSLAALKDIRPYNWTTYANILTVENFMPQFKEKIDEFQNNLQQDPPEFIVYVMAPESSPNIYYRLQDAEYLKWFDIWVKANYVERKTISSGVVSWPYGYEYKVFQLGIVTSER